jgi:hypothetical protein
MSIGLSGTSMVVRRGDDRARRLPGRVWQPLPIRLPFPSGDWYQVYGNIGTDDPINYGLPLVQTQATTWTTASLAPGTWRFGVRASNANGEEQNLDCAVLIVLDDTGNDITNQPMPPSNFRAFATSGGGARVEWFYPPTSGPKTPTGFNVYVGTGGSPSYTNPAATIAYSAGIRSYFAVNLSGLTGGLTYSVGVRANNAAGEEQNTSTIQVTAKTSGPSAVQSFLATAVV